MGDVLKNQPTVVSSTTDTAICTGASIASTVLSILICNEETTDDGTFSIRVKDNSNNDTPYYIYKDQSLPSMATFEHTDKITLMPNDTLTCISSSGQVFCILVNYLEQT